MTDTVNETKPVETKPVEPVKAPAKSAVKTTPSGVPVQGVSIGSTGRYTLPNGLSVETK